MISNLLTVAGNTFKETLRQPIFAVVIAAAVVVLIFCPALSMFTLDDDNQLLKDVGLSTLMVAGLFLAAFAASTVITEEITRKTTLTVLTKKISRHSFIIAKFIGIVLALILAMYLLSLVYIAIVRQGVMQAAVDKSDPVVISLCLIAAGLTLIISLAGNYFYQWRFTAAAVFFASLFMTIVLVILYFVAPDWSFDSENNKLNPLLLPPILLTILATIVLAAVATAAATRLSLIMTLITCIIVFLLGIIIPYCLWPVFHNNTGILHYLAWAGIAVVPHINFFVVSNALYTNTPIPLNYLAQAGLYAFLYVVAMIMFAIALFRSREIG